MYLPQPSLFDLQLWSSAIYCCYLTVCACKNISISNSVAQTSIWFCFISLVSFALVPNSGIPPQASSESILEMWTYQVTLIFPISFTNGPQRFFHLQCHAPARFSQYAPAMPINALNKFVCFVLPCKWFFNMEFRFDVVWHFIHSMVY